MSADCIFERKRLIRGVYKVVFIYTTDRTPVEWTFVFSELVETNKQTIQQFQRVTYCRNLEQIMTAVPRHSETKVWFGHKRPYS